MSKNIFSRPKTQRDICDAAWHHGWAVRIHSLFNETTICAVRGDLKIRIEFKGNGIAWAQITNTADGPVPKLFDEGNGPTWLTATNVKDQVIKALATAGTVVI